MDQVRKDVDAWFTAQNFGPEPFKEPHDPAMNRAFFGLPAWWAAVGTVGRSSRWRVQRLGRPLSSPLWVITPDWHVQHGSLADIARRSSLV